MENKFSTIPIWGLRAQNDVVLPCGIVGQKYTAILTGGIVERAKSTLEVTGQIGGLTRYFTRCVNKGTLYNGPQKKLYVDFDNLHERQGLEAMINTLNLDVHAHCKLAKRPEIRFELVPRDINSENFMDILLCSNPQLQTFFNTDSGHRIFKFKMVLDKQADTHSLIYETDSSIRNYLVNGLGTVFIDDLKVPVFDNIYIIKCLSCLKFGHIKRVCRGVTICRICLQSGHNTRHCVVEGPIHCNSCTSYNRRVKREMLSTKLGYMSMRSVEHPTFSLACPEMIEANINTARQVDYTAHIAW